MSLLIEISIITYYLYPVKGKPDTSNSRRIIIIVTTTSAGVFLSIVLIALSIKYRKQRKQASKLSSPVNIPLSVETPREPLPIDEVINYGHSVGNTVNARYI